VAVAGGRVTVGVKVAGGGGRKICCHQKRANAPPVRS
jgi:hypothetical protein